MAVYTRCISLLFLWVILLAHCSFFVQAKPLKAGTEEGNADLNTEKAQKDNGDEALEKRGLLDALGLSSLSNFGNTGGGTQDWTGATVTGGNSGAQNCFNNSGSGHQSFRGAKINTGGNSPNGGTKNSFNNSGSGTVDFSGAVFNTGARIGVDDTNSDGWGKVGSFGGSADSKTKKKQDSGPTFNTGARIGTDSNSFNSDGWGEVGSFGGSADSKAKKKRKNGAKKDCSLKSAGWGFMNLFG